MGAYPSYFPQVSAPPSAYTPGPYNTGYSGGLGVSGGYNPFSQRDVYNMYQQLGQTYYQQGQDFQNQQAGLADYYGGLEGQYGNLTSNLYAPIWSGGGGYSNDQMNNILQQQGLTDINNELPSNFLTSDEQSAIEGNPYQAYNSFSNTVPYLNSMAADYATGLQEAAAGGETRGNNALANYQQNLTAAINPNALTLSSTYDPSIKSALNTGATALTGAENNPALSPTQDYLKQASVSDQQVNDIASAAAESTGAQFQATKDALYQRAAAAGNTTPLALASAETALDRSSAASQADAATQARLQGLATQREAAQNIQNTQLNAGQYQSGLTSSNALAEQNANIAALSTEEQMRLAAEQGLTGYETSAANALGQAGLNEANYTTNNAMTALEQGGQTGLATEEYGMGNSATLQQQAEAAAAARAGSVATNRQGVAQYNQGMQYNTNNAASNRYQSAYQPWVQEQYMGLQAAPQQQQYYGNQAQYQRELGLQGAQTYGSMGLSAANGYAGWGSEQNQVGFGSNFEKGFGSALGATLGSGGSGYKAPGHAKGAFIDHDQLIEVGEHDRPEVILPLDPKTPPEHRNFFERFGAELGDEWGIPKKGHQTHYATGGILNLDNSSFSHNLRDIDMAEQPDDYQHYARGGLLHMPHTTIPMPKITLPHAGVHLNMPLRLPRISQPIRPTGLPGESTGYAAKPIHPSRKFARGGVVGRNDYMRNVGMERFRPSSRSEMGDLACV